MLNKNFNFIKWIFKEEGKKIKENYGYDLQEIMLMCFIIYKQNILNTDISIIVVKIFA